MYEFRKLSLGSWIREVLEAEFRYIYITENFKNIQSTYKTRRILFFIRVLVRLSSMVMFTSAMGLCEMIFKNVGKLSNYVKFIAFQVFDRFMSIICIMYFFLLELNLGLKWTENLFWVICKILWILFSFLFFFCKFM